MHRYEELEKLYYKKLFLKIAFFAVIFFMILGGIFILKKNNSHNIQKRKTEKIHTKNLEVKKGTKKEVNETQKEIKKEIKIIKKDINNSKEKNGTQNNITFIIPDFNEIKLPSSDINKSNDANNTKQIIKQKIKTVEIKHKANLDIDIKESSVNLKTLINDFNSNQDFSLAITIAKIYLKKNDLKNAQIWALKANSINPSATDSWILFANILLKEKKIKKAKEILKVYINSYGSNDIIEEKLRSLNGN